MTAVQGFWLSLLRDDPSPGLTDSELGWLLSAAPLALALTVATRLQSRGFTPPAPALSCGLILLSSWLATFVLLDELRPNFVSNAGPDPAHLGPGVWLTLLALPGLVSGMALAAAYRRSATPRSR